MEQKTQQERNIVIKAIALGILATLFLSITFISNSVLATPGNNWAWTAALRYLLLLPILAAMLATNRKLKPLLQAMRQNLRIWMRWGSLGFGVFYALLTYASLLAPGWLVAATFQTTILAGLLISPLIYKDHRAKVPKKALLLSSLIVSGIMVMQADKLEELHSGTGILVSFAFALLAAVLWPLGNRKLLLELESQNINLNAMQRVLGMSLGSLPVLLLLGGYGFYTSGLPSNGQVIGSLSTALCSGILGGVLFYKAFQLVKHNPVALATVEATQVVSIVFTLLGEMLLKGAHWPGLYGSVGMLIILLGLSSHIALSIRHCLKLDLEKQLVRVSEGISQELQAVPALKRKQ